MRIVVESAGPEDVPAMASILSDWIDATPWMPRLHSLAEDRGFVAGLLASHEVLVARANGVVGFLARQGGEIDALYVAGAARGRGVGSALLAAALAAEPDLSLWTFQANAGALRFYAARGFVESERTDGSGNAERLPDVRLVRKAGGAA